MSSLSQEEIDALINSLSGPAAPVKEVESKRIKSFDFRFNKRLDKFSNNQLQTLRTLHENFTRLLNNSLSVYLRTRVEASIVSIEQISYGDFIASIGIPSILSIFSMDPLAGSGIVQIDQVESALSKASSGSGSDWPSIPTRSTGTRLAATRLPASRQAASDGSTAWTRVTAGG